MKNLFFSAYKKVFSYITSIVIFMVSLPYAYSQDVVVNTTKHLFTVKNRDNAGHLPFVFDKRGIRIGG